MKEHLGALGDRSAGWYRRLAALPNVRLIDPHLDIYGLIRDAAIVVTISGTVGYEAALMGVPSIGLAPVYFAPILANPVTAQSHPLEWPLPELLKPRPATEPAAQRERLVHFLARLHANSFSGDPAQLGVPDEQRARPDHLAAEKLAFESFVGALRRRRTTHETARA